MIKNIRVALEREMDRTGLRGKKLSRDAGLNESAVRDLMSKVDDPRVGTLLKLAAALGVPASFLFDNFIPVTGLVGPNGIVRFVDEKNPMMVPRPPTPLGEIVAIRVVDDGLRPAHRAGDVLFFSRQSDVIELDYIGDECVAQTMDGSVYLRTLAPGTNAGTHTLRHWTGLDSENVVLAWAAPVLFSMRRAALPDVS